MRGKLLKLGGVCREEGDKLNIPELGFLKAADDHEKLVHFLRWLGDFLDELVAESLKSGKTKLFDAELTDELRNAIVDAWREIRQKEIVEKAANMQAKVPLQELERSGLTGHQLSLKMGVLRWLCEKFIKHPSAGVLRRFLTTIDNLLGSLAHGNPLAEALMEFKEALESLAHEQ